MKKFVFAILLPVIGGIGSIATVVSVVTTHAPSEIKNSLVLNLPPNATGAIVEKPVISNPANARFNTPSNPRSLSKYEYTISENQPKFIEEAQTNLSVAFQNIGGVEFARLNILPVGYKSSITAILTGYTEEFVSSTGTYNVQIIHVDYDNRNILVQVSKKVILP